MRVPEVFRNNTEWLLIVAGAKAGQVVEPLLKRHGVSMREMTVMKLIDGQEMNQQAIASVLNINRNAVVDVADSLERKGLARRQKNPENRREQFVMLTDKGLHRVHDWAQDKSKQRYWVAEILSKAECDHLTNLLVYLIEAV